MHWGLLAKKQPKLDIILTFLGLQMKRYRSQDGSVNTLRSSKKTATEGGYFW